jgi:hypothetical protein
MAATSQPLATQVALEEKPERMQMDTAKGQLVDKIISAYKSL